MPFIYLLHITTGPYFKAEYLRNQLYYYQIITQLFPYSLQSYLNDQLIIIVSMGCNQSQKQTDNFGVLSKPHIFFLLGGPGSGKGTQADNLVRDYKFKHLSTGDLLREQKQKGGPLAQELENMMKEGKLISSDLVVRLLDSAITTYGHRRYLIDGFPRNQENWKVFEEQLADKVVIRNLIYFQCTEQTLVARMMERAKTSGRPDDNPESIKKRISTFNQETVPILSKFQGSNCIKIDATGTKEEVYSELKTHLSALNVHPPAKAEMIFVLGGPGSGKGTQCDILVKKYKFIHLSTGDLLREEVKKGSKLAKELQAVMKEGKLISSKQMVSLIRQKIESYNFGGRYLLDGFPRGQQNMDVWKENMEQDVNLRSVVYFQCSEGELKRRLLQRGKTSGRADDNEQSIVKRLKVFNEQTKPVVEHYQKSGKLRLINAEREITVITEDVEKHLDQLGIFPAS